MIDLQKCFSTFLILRPFNTVPHVVVTPTRKIIFVATLLLEFGTVMNLNGNIHVFQ